MKKLVAAILFCIVCSSTGWAVDQVKYSPGFPYVVSATSPDTTAYRDNIWVRSTDGKQFIFDEDILAWKSVDTEIWRWIDDATTGNVWMMGDIENSAFNGAAAYPRIARTNIVITDAFGYTADNIDPSAASDSIYFGILRYDDSVPDTTRMDTLMWRSDSVETITYPNIDVELSATDAVTIYMERWGNVQWPQIELYVHERVDP